MTGDSNTQFVPKGTVNITENGLVDVKAYETANVNVPPPFNPFEYMKRVIPSQSFNGITFPDGTVMRFRELTTNKDDTPWVFYFTTCNDLTLIFDKQQISLAYWLFYLIGDKLTIIGDTSQVKNYNSFLRNANLTEVIGTIDFTSAENCGYFALNANKVNQKKLSITFASNTLKCSLDGNTILTDASKISFANALNETVKDKYASGFLRNTNTILGNSILDETETYHLFVEDENGEMTLQDFVTNVKGWTIT